MRVAAFVQGITYVASGLWPIVHLRRFEAVTGKKRDTWLVQTTGALIAAIGATLLVGAFERRRSRAVKALGVLSAGTLATADLVFVGARRIPRIYLGDAALEAGVIATWLAVDR